MSDYAHLSIKRFASDLRGGPAIEFALTAPVLALLILGIVGIGFEADARMDAREAIRAGAHAAMLGESDPAEIRQIVLDTLGATDGSYDAQATPRFRCETDVVDEDATCSDDQPPEQYFVISLEAPAGVAYAGAPALSANIEVRVE
jgi:Flp pilus assembly protein TadG